MNKELLQIEDNLLEGACTCGICNQNYNWHYVLSELKWRTIPEESQEANVVCDADAGIYEDDGFDWRRIEVYSKCPRCNIKNKTIERIKLNK